jgi:choice-of-anchor B domain-containing protein
MSFLLLLILMCSNAIGQTSQSVQLLGNYQGHKERNPQGTYYSSVWGYYDADGREYAFLGCFRGTAIVDLTYLPDSLHEVAFIPGPVASYSYREFKTYLHYLYIVSEGGEGVQIVDLSGLPNSVRFVGSFTYPGYTRTHTIGESDGYLYLNGGNATPVGGTAIVSVRTPEQPELVGAFNGHYVHDTYARGDRLYAAGIYGQGLTILNIANKQAPTVLKTITYPGAGTHNAWTTDDGAYVLTTDEIGFTPKTLKIWDVRDVQNTSQVAEWNPRPAETIHNVCVKGDFAYVAYYKAGFLVADISNRTGPTLAGYYDTYPSTSSALYDGAWGVYPYLPSGRILVSDMQTGLYVFRFDAQQIGRIEGRITDAATGTPIQNALMRIQETGQTRWTNSSGKFMWGYAVGTFNLSVEKNGYQTRTLSAIIVRDQTVTMNVALIPAAPTDADDNNNVPAEFSLHQNFPNPFNPSTTILFDLPTTARAELVVVDVLGREHARLVDGVLSNGRHRVQFALPGLPSGVYFSILRVDGRFLSRSMLMVK